MAAILYAMLLLGCAAAQAQALNAAAAHLKVNFINLTWRVNADSTTVYEQAVEREALSEQGAQAATKFAQMYNKTLQRYEVLDAYTLKADGRKIPVEKEGIQIQSGIASGSNSSSWPDAEIMQITFPDVQKGDRTGWSTRITTHTPQLPGWASLDEYLIPSVQVDRFSAILEAPQSLDLQVVAVGMRMTTTQRQQNQVWRIVGENKATLMDSNVANLNVAIPRLLASTYKDHIQLGSAFSKQLNAKVLLTDEVKQLAQKITEGTFTQTQKATAIHNWVRKNIRYVAVYLGTGGWVPHDVSWVLKNGYGDCKDHVVLMQTLLKAVDIEAVPVLINTTNTYELAELPVGANHCIVYIPGLNLFADPTDGRIPPGALPWADSDKPVVVALNDGAKIMRTPAFTPANNRVTVKTQLDIAKNGKATGSIVLDAAGSPATTLQDRLAQIPAGMGGVAVQKILEESNLRGRGLAQYATVQRDAQAQALKITDLEIENLLNDPTAGSITPPPRAQSSHVHPAQHR
jgi:transglutaminase-like putative cysteine protease